MKDSLVSSDYHSVIYTAKIKPNAIDGYNTLITFEGYGIPSGMTFVRANTYGKDATPNSYLVNLVNDKVEKVLLSLDGNYAENYEKIEPDGEEFTFVTRIMDTYFMR